MSQDRKDAFEPEARTPLPKSSPELRLDKISEIYYPYRKLKEEIVARLKKVINKELEDSGASSEDQSRIISELFAELTKPPTTHSLLPDKAPAFYKDRSDKTQSAEDFTWKHYSEYFDKGLTRADLKRLDLSLYRMLMKGKFPASLADKIPPAQGKGGGGRKPKLSDAERGERARARSRETSKRHRIRHGG